jgi:ABC-type multidrug transport system fused ATPase/permease subunit
MAFIWACSRGARGYILLLALLSAAMSIFEALMFAMLGRIVDWLGNGRARQPVGRPRPHAGAGWIVVASIVVVALQTIVKHQTMAINFPMRLRWNFHRLMLGQSMAFYQDEFAGRLTTKVMQTALAVRDTLFRAGRRAGRHGGLCGHHDGAGRRLRHEADRALPGLAGALHRRAVISLCRSWAASASSRPTRAR